MKITAKDAKYIQNRHRNLSRFINYELEKTTWNGYVLTFTMKLIPYILVFVPVHLFKAITLLWDGGLKEFCFESRLLYTSNIMPDRDVASSHCLRADEIWNKYTKEAQ